MSRENKVDEDVLIRHLLASLIDGNEADLPRSQFFGRGREKA